MTPSELIDSYSNGVPMERILFAVTEGRDRVSVLQPDQLELFESMLKEIRKGVHELAEAISSDNVVKVKATVTSLQEIFTMIKDAA